MTEVTFGAAQTAEETTTEAQALAEILAWSKDCPKWQRDALRRLCTKDDLDDNGVAPV
jgi:hypothetical protein